MNTEECRMNIEEWRMNVEEWRMNVEEWRMNIEEWRMTKFSRYKCILAGISSLVLYCLLLLCAFLL